MKKITQYGSTLLILVLMASSLSTAFTVLSFKLNQSYIASELCVNRDVPDSDCHGKCYLTKKLQQQNKERNEGNAPEVRQNEIHWISSYTSAYNCTIMPSTTIFPVFDVIVSKGYPRGVDHPPTA